jgi:hypothetical protein
MAEAKQCWSIIGWVTKNVLPRALPYFGKHVKSLVVSIHQPALGPRGELWPVLVTCDS